MALIDHSRQLIYGYVMARLNCGYQPERSSAKIFVFHHHVRLSFSIIINFTEVLLWIFQCPFASAATAFQYYFRDLWLSYIIPAGISIPLLVMGNRVHWHIKFHNHICFLQESCIWGHILERNLVCICPLDRASPYHTVYSIPWDLSSIMSLSSFHHLVEWQYGLTLN